MQMKIVIAFCYLRNLRERNWFEGLPWSNIDDQVMVIFLIWLLSKHQQVSELCHLEFLPGHQYWLEICCRGQDFGLVISCGGNHSWLPICCRRNQTGLAFSSRGHEDGLENLLGAFSQRPGAWWEFPWSPPWGTVLPPPPSACPTVFTNLWKSRGGIVVNGASREVPESNQWTP